MNASYENIKSPVYFVLLAGGSGERLWPLSRQAMPKQLLSVDATEQTLLDQALARISGMYMNQRTWIITNKKIEEHITKTYADKMDRIIIEDEARNTCPAILHACLEIYDENPDAIVIFLPADAFIPQKDYDNFKTALSEVISFSSKQDGICLLGLKPTYPATGYGYIEYDLVDTSAIHKVKNFHEKPSLQKALEYMEQETMLWNIGIFAGHASTFIREGQEYIPNVIEMLRLYKNGTIAYKDIPSISIDYAIIEQSKTIWVFPADFSWCDVGNLDRYLTLKSEHGSLQGQKIILIDSENNVVNTSNKLIALIGVDDLCVIETSDALLITRRDKTEQVKQVVNHLKERNYTEYL